jgi:hypothetical protein
VAAIAGELPLSTALFAFSWARLRFHFADEQTVRCSPDQYIAVFMPAKKGLLGAEMLVVIEPCSEKTRNHQSSDDGLLHTCATDVKRDFGAVGDGKTDDTAAFLKAFSSLPGGALYVPPGR